LESIFYPNNPLHDGAVVISDDRILSARCVVQSLPQVKLDPPFGTRHKAGLSITQETDAISIMVSEQRGKVSLAENGKLEVDLSRAGLTEKLAKLL
jgi:diadenylate cyclase